ncbi:uncharacterized protein LOC124708368 isoform X3 [Lolium rigidum]|uniref:uncharacterized protein LOC124708368 isoform X3 n=1 Tax=Lolium rigidum TaxID=89674 RepID=UPI001F5D0D7C|nr:uncharacterized protein LOC124708368 isoform X3 [Lolium rigidum]
MLDDDQSFHDGISSPIAAHILDFCDDGSGGGDLFAAVNASSDVFAASSEDASSSSTTATPPLCSHGGDNMSSSGAATAAVNAFSPLQSLDSTLSALLEDDQPPGPDAELLLPIDYAFGADETQREQQQFSQMVLSAAAAAEHHRPALQTQMSSTASDLMQLASGYNDECFAAALAGEYMGLDDTALCQQQQPGGAMLPSALGDAATQGCYAAAQGGFFGGSGCAGTVMSMMLGMEEIGEYQRMMEGAGALVDADASAQMAFPAASEMQMGSGSTGQLPASASAAGAESSSLEDTSFKAARLSVEERKEKIHRYIKKRNERNFSKKIKYACRKTLADSRPRVRGRFAKNDEYCESSRAIGSQNHDEYDQMIGVKGEDMLDSEALAHITGMSSYMYNHTVESWI